MVTRGLAMLSLVLTLAGSAGAEQLLKNPGFAETQDNRPAGWGCSGAVALSNAGRNDSSAVVLGKQGRVLQVVPLVAGYAYRGSVWARGKGEVVLTFYEYHGASGNDWAGSSAAYKLKLTDQWQPFDLTYSQGPREADRQSIAFAVLASGDEAEVVVDDAALDKSPLPDPLANLLLNPQLADADGDGWPDQWQGEARRLSLDHLPDGTPSVRLRCGVFSADYSPGDGRDWFNWPRWGEQHGSGWPAMPRPLGGQYTVMLESAAVPILPRQRYDVHLRLKELEVWGEFIAVRWFDANRKPTAAFEERLAYHHLSEGNTGGWLDYLGRATAPEEARFAAVVVGVKQGSGTLWVTRPALTLGLGAPGAHEPRYERTPVDLPEPPVALPPATARQARLGPRPRPAVSVQEQGLHLVLTNGVALTLPLAEGNLRGVTEVTYRGWPLRNPQAPPLSPLIRTEPLRLHTACRYRSYERSPDGGVVVHSALLTDKGEADELDWHFAPAEEVVGGQERHGFRYRYDFRSGTARLRFIMDRATWEVGGQALGLRVGQALYPLTPASQYCLAWDWRFVGGELFDYETGAGGTLLTYPDSYQTSLYGRAATPDFVVFQDTYHFADVPAGQSPWRTVLYTPRPGGADDWARVRDQLYARERRQLGAPAETPLQPAAMYIGYGGLRGIGSLRPEDPKIEQVAYYNYVADNVVPRIADLGFKRLMMVLPRAPWNWPIEDINHVRPEYAAPFKRLCDLARQRGLAMIAWYGTVQNLDKAPMWQEHPEFILWGPNHERARTYYSPWGWPGKLEAGFARYTLDGLRQAREQTGLAGLWLDSYLSATHLMNTADFAEAVRQAEGLLPWHAAVEKLGYFTYCEGSPHGLGTDSQSGWQQPQDWSRFRPEQFYKQGLYLQQPWSKSARPLGISDLGAFLADPAKRYYYRMLANYCCPILDLGHFGDDSAALDRIAQANRDFNAVCDLMQVRHLRDAHGVEWSAPGGRALFVYEAMGYALPPGLGKVRDVTVGKAVTVTKGQARLLPYHTYRVTR